MTEKLTKDECVKALNALYFSDGTDGRDDECYRVLMELINEHFDNLPLKFEELEVGMWVWDNELRMYFLIKGKFNITVGSYKVLEIITSNLSNGTWHYNTCHIYYQENRFYRKQVEE